MLTTESRVSQKFFRLLCFLIIISLTLNLSNGEERAEAMEVSKAHQLVVDEFARLAGDNFVIFKERRCHLDGDVYFFKGDVLPRGVYRQANADEFTCLYVIHPEDEATLLKIADDNRSVTQVSDWNILERTTSRYILIEQEKAIFIDYKAKKYYFFMYWRQ